MLRNSLVCRAADNDGDQCRALANTGPGNDSRPVPSVPWTRTAASPDPCRCLVGAGGAARPVSRVVERPDAPRPVARRSLGPGRRSVPGFVHNSVDARPETTQPDGIPCGADRIRRGESGTPDRESDNTRMAEERNRRKSIHVCLQGVFSKISPGPGNSMHGSCSNSPRSDHAVGPVPAPTTCGHRAEGHRVTTGFRMTAVRATSRCFPRSPRRLAGCSRSPGMSPGSSRRLRRGPQGPSHAATAAMPGSLGDDPVDIPAIGPSGNGPMAVPAPGKPCVLSIRDPADRREGHAPPRRCRTVGPWSRRRRPRPENGEIEASWQWRGLPRERPGATMYNPFPFPFPHAGHAGGRRRQPYFRRWMV